MNEDYIDSDIPQSAGNSAMGLLSQMSRRLEQAPQLSDLIKRRDDALNEYKRAVIDAGRIPERSPFEVMAEGIAMTYDPMDPWKGIRGGMKNLVDHRGRAREEEAQRAILATRLGYSDADDMMSSFGTAGMTPGGIAGLVRSDMVTNRQMNQQWSKAKEFAINTLGMNEAQATEYANRSVSQSPREVSPAGIKPMVGSLMPGESGGLPDGVDLPAGDLNSWLGRLKGDIQAAVGSGDYDKAAELSRAARAISSKINSTQTKTDVEIDKERRKEELKLDFVPKQKAAELHATEEEKRESSLPEAKNTLMENISSLDKLLGMVDSVVKHPGLGSAAGWQSNFPTLGGSDASNFEETLKPLQSGIALDMLQSMKDRSKTGASGFGALTEKELDLLLNSLGSLSVKQSDKQLKSNLLGVSKLVQDMRGRELAAYERSFGKYGPNPAVPGANSSKKVVRTGRDKKTGKKVEQYEDGSVGYVE